MHLITLSTKSILIFLESLQTNVSQEESWKERNVTWWCTQTLPTKVLPLQRCPSPTPASQVIPMDLSVQGLPAHSSSQTLTPSGCKLSWGDDAQLTLISALKQGIKCLNFTKTQMHLCDRKGGLCLNCLERSCLWQRRSPSHYSLMGYKQFTTKWIKHWKTFNRSHQLGSAPEQYSQTAYPKKLSMQDAHL